MRNLDDFSVSNDGEISLCEIDGRVQSQNFEHANVSTLTTVLDKHPKIQITRDLLQSVGTGDEGRALFLPVHVPFLKQLTQIYYEQGMVEALRVASNHHQFLVAKSALVALKLLNYVREVQILLNPALKYSGPNLINELSLTRNWLNHIIRCFTWHPHTTKIAVVTCDDSIRIYSSDQPSYVPLLRCKQQKNVSCVAWRPSSMSELAVGYESGIIIWNIDPNSLITRPSISNAIILQRLDHKPVISLTWGLCGEFLVSAAACHSTLMVWDPELDRTNYLKSGFGNALLKLSPKGNKLFSSTNGIVFRIWDCCTWESERWTVLSGRVQCACWVNNGQDLLFSTSHESVIYGLTVGSDVVFTSTNVANVPNQAMPVFDLSKVELDGIMVGGLVQNMESNPEGSHLAVLFKYTNCVALFNVVKQPNTVQLVASSLVLGLPAEIPSCIGFQRDFKNKACLTIGWSSGRIQYYPVVYTDLGEEGHRQRADRTILNETLYGSFSRSFHG